MDANDATEGPSLRHTGPALRDYVAAIALIALVGGLALVLLGCQTSRILSAVSGSV